MTVEDRHRPRSPATKTKHGNSFSASSPWTRFSKDTVLTSSPPRRQARRSHQSYHLQPLRLSALRCNSLLRTHILCSCLALFCRADDTCDTILPNQMVAHVTFSKRLPLPLLRQPPSVSIFFRYCSSLSLSFHQTNILRRVPREGQLFELFCACTRVSVRHNVSNPHLTSALPRRALPCLIIVCPIWRC